MKHSFLSSFHDNPKRLVFALIPALLLSHVAWAATDTWNSASGTSWNTPANWTSGVKAGSATDVIFDNSQVTLPAAIGLDAAQSANSLTFGSSNGPALGAFILEAHDTANTAETLTLTTGNITMDSSVTGTITLGGNSATHGVLTLASSASGFTVANNNTTQTLNIAAIVSGTGKNLSLNSAGGLIILGGANTATGAATVGNGSDNTLVQIANAGALTKFTGTGTIVNAGSTVDLNGTALTSTIFTLNGAGFGSGVDAGALVNSTGTATNAGAITLGSAATIKNSGAALTLSGAINNGGFMLTVADGGSSSLITLGSGAISGGGGLTMAGTGTLTLSGANTFTGGLNINSGTVKIGSATSVGAGTVTIGSVGQSAILDLNGQTETILGLTTAGTAANQTIGNSSTTAAATLNYTGATTTTFGGVIQNTLGSGTKTTAVTVNNANADLILSGANTYSGATTITAGILNIQNATALGTSAVTVSSGGTLQFQNVTGTVSNAINLSGTGAAGATGALENVSGSNTYSGVITLVATSTISSDSGILSLTNTTTTAVGNFSLTLTGSGNGVITGAFGNGSGTLTKTGTGTWTLSGSNSNAMTGGAVINDGTLLLDFSASSASSNILSAHSDSMGGGTLYIKGNAGAVNSQSLATTLTLTAGASNLVLNGNGATSLLASVTGITRSTGATLNVTLPTGSQSATNGFTITGGSSKFTLSNNVLVSAATNGVAYATVDGTDWASGSSTNVVALASYNNDDFSAAANNTNVTGNDSASGFTINTLRFGTDNVTLANTGVSTISTGGILVTSATDTTGVTISGGSIQSGGGKELVIIDNGKLTISSVIANSASGSSALTFSGSGVTTLDGTDNHTGATYLNGGTVVLGNATGLSSGALTFDAGTLQLNGNSATYAGLSGGDVNATVSDTNATSATLTLSPSGTATFTGNLTDGAGGGKLNVSMAGTVTGNQVLAGTDTYTGTTTVKSGALDFLNTNSLYDGNTSSWTNTNIDVKSGATLAFGYGNTGQFSAANIATLLSNLGTGSGGFEAGSAIGFDTTGLSTSDTYASVITDTIAGPLGVTKLGSNILLLSATNTYTGVTTVAGGTLQISALQNGGVASNIGESSNAASNLVILAGGTLSVNTSGTSTDRLFSIGGGGTASITSGGVTMSFTNTGAIGFVDSNTSNTLSFGTNSNNTAVNFSPQITDNGTGKTSVLQGASALGYLKLLNANNTYTGATTVGGNNGGSIIYVNKLTNGGVTNISITTTSGSTSATLGSTTGLIMGDTYGVSSGNVANGSTFVYSGSTSVTLSSNALVTGTDSAPTIGLPSSIGIATNSGSNLVFTSGAGVLDYTGSGDTTDRNYSLTGNGTGVTFSSDGTGALVMTGHETSDLYANGNSLTLSGANTNANSYGGLIANLVSTSHPVSFTKAGTGYWALLDAANSYTGVTSITGGTLNVAALANGGLNSSIGASSNAATNLVFGGTSSGTSSILQYTGSLAQSTDRLFTIGTATAGTNNATIDASGTGSGTVSFSNTGAITLINTAAHSLTLTGSNSGANIFALSLGDFNGANLTSFTKSGAGTWDLTGIASTYTGVTTIDGGILNVASLTLGGSASSIGASTSAGSNLVFGGSTLQYTGSTAQTTDRLFTIGDANGTTATLDASGSSPSATVSFTGTGELTIGGSGPHSLTLTGSNTGANTFAPIIVDSFSNSTSLTKSGAGTWVLDGENTYTGTTYIDGGILNAGVADEGGVGLDATSGAFGDAADSISGAQIIFGGGTLQYSAASASSDYSSRIFNSTSAISIDTNGQNVTFATSLDSSNTGGLAKLGAGKLTLAAANAFTGDVTINQGIISVGSLASIGSVQPLGEGDTVILAGANSSAPGILQYTGSDATLDQDITVTTGDVGTIGNTGGDLLTLAGDISKNGSVLNFSDGQFNITGVISGALPNSDLNVTGNSTVTLSSSNTYSGPTTVNDTSTLYANAASSTGSGSVSVNSTGTLSGTGTLAPTGINNLTVNSGGILAPGVNSIAGSGIAAPGKSIIPFLGTPGTMASPGLTLDTTGFTGGGPGTVTGSLGSNTPLANFNGASLTFALGAGTSSSAMVVGGTANNVITFSGDSVVSINDLVGSQLTLNQEYVLIQGNGNTTYDIGPGSSLIFGNTSSLGTLIVGGLTLLAPNTPNNFFSEWFSGSQLYLSGDDIVVDVVPEPGTWAMMLAGFALLLVIQHRRRKQS